MRGAQSPSVSLLPAHSSRLHIPKEEHAQAPSCFCFLPLLRRFPHRMLEAYLHCPSFTLRGHVSSLDALCLPPEALSARLHSASVWWPPPILLAPPEAQGQRRRQG